MPKKKELILDFLDTGEILLETEGFKGPVCEEEALKFLEEAYNKGFTTKDYKQKVEWHLRNHREVRKNIDRGIKITNHCG